MAAHLLQELLAIGEKMVETLETGQIDEYLVLLDERGTLVDTITAYRHPSDIDPNWEEMTLALSRQSEVLKEAADAQHARMQEAVTRFGQVKDAQRTYRQLPERRNILNENLRV